MLPHSSSNVHRPYAPVTLTGVGTGTGTGVGTGTGTGTGTVRLMGIESTVPFITVPFK